MISARVPVKIFQITFKYRTTKHRNAENKHQKRVELEQTAFLF